MLVDIQKQVEHWMILKNMNNLKITNKYENIMKETEILNRKPSKAIYKSPVLYKLGSIIKKTAGGGGGFSDVFTPSPFDVS